MVKKMIRNPDPPLLLARNTIIVAKPHEKCILALQHVHVGFIQGVKIILTRILCICPQYSFLILKYLLIIPALFSILLVTYYQPCILKIITLSTSPKIFHNY